MDRPSNREAPTSPSAAGRGVVTPEAISELAEALADACQSRLDDLAAGRCCPMGALLSPFAGFPASNLMIVVGVPELVAHEFMGGYDSPYSQKPSELRDLGRQFRERYRGRR